MSVKFHPETIPCPIALCRATPTAVRVLASSILLPVEKGYQLPIRCSLAIQILRELIGRISLSILETCGISVGFPQITTKSTSNADANLAKSLKRFLNVLVIASLISSAFTSKGSVISMPTTSFSSANFSQSDQLRVWSWKKAALV